MQLQIENNIQWVIWLGMKANIEDMEAKEGTIFLKISLEKLVRVRYYSLLTLNLFLIQININKLY